MPEQMGWVLNPAQPPHLVLTAPLGTLKPDAIRPATANGRDLLVFSGADDEALPVRFVELDSGALLPDRSLLHSAELVALGTGLGRTLLATVTRNGTVAVRDALTGVPVGPAFPSSSSPRAVAVFVDGGRELVAVAWADRCRVWDAGDGSPVVVQDFGGAALVVHEERLLAVSGTRLRNVLSGEAHGQPLTIDGPVVAAVVHRDRVLVVSAGTAVRMWDASKGNEVRGPADWPGTDVLHRLALVEGGDGLAAVVRWRTPAGDTKNELWEGSRRSSLPDGEAVAILVQEGRLLTAVAGRGGALSVSGVSSPYFGGPVLSFGGWARRSGRMLAVLTTSTGEPAMLYDTASGLPYARVALPGDQPDGPLEIELDGGGVLVRDSNTGREVLRRDGQHDNATVAVTAAATRDTDDDAVLVTGGADGTVRVWKLSNRKPVGGPWAGHAGPVTAVTVTRWRGQQVVVSADDTGSVRMWLIGGPVRHAGHQNEVTALASGILQGRSVFASGGDDGTIRFWDPLTDSEAGEPIHCGPVSGLTFAGDLLVVATGDAVQRWDPATRQPVGAPLPGSGRVVGIECFGRTVIVALAGSQLHVWDAASGAPHAVLSLPGPAKLLDVTADGDRLLALTVSEPDKALFPEAGGIDSEQITLWDVSAGNSILRMLTSDDGGHGAFGRIGGRLVVVHGVDARKNAPGEGVWPEETGDIYLRDIATGKLLGDFRRTAASISNCSSPATWFWWRLRMPYSYGIRRLADELNHRYARLPAHSPALPRSRRAAGLLLPPGRGWDRTDMGSQAVGERGLRVHVQETFPFERVADAHRLLQTGHTRGKLVLTV